MRKFVWGSVLALLAVLIIISCNKNPDADEPKNDFDRKALLTNVADNIIILSLFLPIQISRLPFLK
jgi:hypothetical protein